MSKSPEEMTAAMIANMEEKTGKPLAGWLPIVTASGLAKHGQIVKYLKSEQGVTHGYANLIAHQFLHQDAASSDDQLIDTQYAGPKAALRPIWEAIQAAVSKFGGDVEISPKKAYVSLRRNKQFALVQPSTRTRVDVGIQLKGEPAGERLEASGSFNAMVSHRVRLTDAAQVDDELIGWLRQAYEKA